MKIEIRIVFIFDSGYVKKEIKGMKLLKCDFCNKKTSQDLTEISFYITAFEQPVIPYRKRHVLICRICGRGRELSREEFEKYLTPPEDDRADHLQKPEFLYQKTRQAGKKFCNHCGARIREKAKFCSECGKSLK